jgi:hypothetical protein
VGLPNTYSDSSRKSCGSWRKGLILLCRPDLLFLSLIAVLLGFVAVMPMRMNHDCSFMLYTGRLLTEGKTLYVDWWDNSPPLIFYLNTLPALISKFSGINMLLVFSISVVAIVLCSALSIRRQLIYSNLEISQSNVGILLIFWVTFSLYVYQQNDFGQKDHLFILFFVPFFVCRWIRCEKGTSRLLTAILTGFLGAVGTCIKPTFVIMALITEAYFLLRYRSFKNLVQPEIAVFVTTCICHAAHFLILSPMATTNLIERMPYLLFEVYPKLMAPASFADVIANNEFYFLVLCALFPLLVTAPRAGDLWKMARPMSAMVIAGITIYLIHFKGFSYHFLSALGPAFLILGISSAESRLIGFQDSHAGSRFTLSLTCNQACWVMLFALALMISGVVYRITTKSPSRFADTPFSRLLVQYSEASDYVLVLSAERGVIWPILLQSERRQASRHGMVEELPLFYQGITEGPDGRFPYHTLSNAPREEFRLLMELKEDIQKFKPKLIVIHDPIQCRICPPGFRMLDYLTAMGLVGEAMEDYESAHKFDDFFVYIRRRH